MGLSSLVKDPNFKFRDFTSKTGSMFEKLTVLNSSIKGVNLIQNLSHLPVALIFACNSSILMKTSQFWVKNGLYPCKPKANSLERVPTVIHNGYHRCQIWSSTSVLKPTRLRPRLVLREHPPIRVNLLTKVLIYYQYSIILSFYFKWTIWYNTIILHFDNAMVTKLT